MGGHAHLAGLVGQRMAGRTHQYDGEPQIAPAERSGRSLDYLSSFRCRTATRSTKWRDLARRRSHGRDRCEYSVNRWSRRGKRSQYPPVGMGTVAESAVHANGPASSTWTRLDCWFGIDPQRQHRRKLDRGRQPDLSGECRRNGVRGIGKWHRHTTSRKSS